MQLNRERWRESGFTLVELLLVIVILGIISVPVANLVIGYFRDTTQTSPRLNESHDAQIVNAYWQQDVASVGIRGAFDTVQQTFPLQQSVNTAFACAVPSGITTPFVVLSWNTFDSSGNATLVSAAYATASSGTQLVRLHCTGTTLDANNVIAHNLTTTPGITCAGTSGSSCIGTGASVPATVSMALSVRDPADKQPAYAITLTGQRRQTT